MLPITVLTKGHIQLRRDRDIVRLPLASWRRLASTRRSRAQGWSQAKPDLGIQFGAGGDTATVGLESIGTADPSRVTSVAKRFIGAGVERMMIESEGITENVKGCRTDVVRRILRDVPMERVMFEAAEQAVFNSYVREFGVGVNLFLDHSQIVQLSCLRAGIWGMADTFGKIATFRPE